MEVGPGSGSNWTGVSSKDAATSDPQRKQQSWNICMDGGGGLYRLVACNFVLLVCRLIGL